MHPLHHRHTQTPEHRQYHIYPTLRPTILRKQLILPLPSASTPFRSAGVTVLRRPLRCSRLYPHAEVVYRAYGGYTGKVHPAGPPPPACRAAGSGVCHGVSLGSPFVALVEKWGRGGWETERMILAAEDAQDCTRIYYRGFVVTGNGLFQL